MVSSVWSSHARFNMMRVAVAGFKRAREHVAASTHFRPVGFYKIML